jgi:glycosyltransferase involved in cell wall biosynthesis
MRVSVIIPVFNGAKTIAKAIDSALAQSFDGDCEIIVINDGSTDGTFEVLDNYGSRIKVRSQLNRGLAATRNAGAAIAGGEYLAFLDADDVWRPQKLARVIEPLERDRRIVLAYSDVFPVDDCGAAAGPSPITQAFARPPTMADLLDQWWPILPSTVMIRRATFEYCGGFFEGYRRAYEDADLWLRARELGDFAYVAEALVVYQTTSIAARMDRYEADYAVFRERVQARYRRRARALLRATRKAYVSSLGHRGLLAMAHGDRAAARAAFIGALSYNPLHVRTALRFARTFLPFSIARALSGRSRERMNGEA